MHEEDKDKEENEGRGEEKLVEEEEDHEEKCAPMWTDARRDGEARRRERCIAQEKQESAEKEVLDTFWHLHFCEFFSFSRTACMTCWATSLDAEVTSLDAEVNL